MAEEKNQKLEASSAQLEDRVKELEGLLCKAHRKCEAKTMVCEVQKKYKANFVSDSQGVCRANEGR